jgi:hypothetical protein
MTTIKEGPQANQAGRPTSPTSRINPPLCVISVMDTTRSGFPPRHQVSPIGAAPPPHPGKRCDSKHEKTTMIYTHVLNRGGLAIRSPLD